MIQQIALCEHRERRRYVCRNEAEAGGYFCSAHASLHLAESRQWRRSGRKPGRLGQMMVDRFDGCSARLVELPADE